MNELIKLVSERSRISEDAAGIAVRTILNFLREKLPAPVATQLTDLLGQHIPGFPAEHAGPQGPIPGSERGIH